MDKTSRGSVAPKGAPSGKHFVASMALQALGAVSALGVAYLISLRLGLPAQGHFGLLKGWSDVLVTVLLFGLPQSLLHYSYSNEISLGRLRGFARRYCMILFAVAVVAAAALAAFDHEPTGWVVLAVPGLVFHGLLRALLLRSGGVIAYALVTVIPSVSLAVFVAVLVGLRLDRWEWGIVASSVLSVLFVVRMAASLGLEKPVNSGPMSKGMWRSNLHSFVFNVSAAAQPAMLLTIVSALSTSATDVGELSFALYFLQVFAMFAGFAAPTLYDRYARSATMAVTWVQDGPAMLRLAVIGVVGLFGVLFALPRILSLVFPGNYLVALDACLIMTVAGAALLVNRLLATLLQVRGRFGEMGYQAITRIALSAAGTIGLSSTSIAGPAVSATIAVLVSELAVLVRAALVVRVLLVADTAAQSNSGS